MVNIERSVDIKSGNRKISNGKANNYRLILFSSIIASLNVLFVTNYVVSMVIIAMEIAALMYYFIKNDMTKYIGSYLVFLCLSFEFSDFLGVDQFYGFKNFRILGLNLGIVALLPIFMKLVLKKNNWISLKKNYSYLFWFSSSIFLMTLSGVIIGLANLILNDNYITQMENFVILFLGNVYELGIFPILVISVFLFLVMNENGRINLLKDYLYAILVGSVVAMIVSLLFGRFGTYGGADTLLVPNVVNFIPFLSGMIFYNEKIKSKKLIIIALFIGMFLLYKYNASGKLFLILFLIPFYILFVISNQRRLYSLIAVIVFIPILYFSMSLIISNSDYATVLFKSKLNQAFALIDIGNSNWLENLPESPRFRITEFMNIIQEYTFKPLYLFFGKGYLGTIRDHLGVFAYSEGAFSYEQWNNGSFYALHASINTIFLTYGVFGLLVYINIGRLTITKLIKSQWGIIGSYWFLIYFGYSITISAFGLIALLIAFWDLDNKPEEKLLLENGSRAIVLPGI